MYACLEGISVSKFLKYPEHHMIDSLLTCYQNDVAFG